jgi:glycosyltransferase involved in cell wall biosynthesis
MKLSILIPTHNRPKLFSRALHSVLNILPKYEIQIIVNNDSNDIVEQYSDNVCIKYYYYKYNDISSIYRQLFERSSGEFVYFLEDDDYILPNFFNCLDYSYDINYMEYISEPLINLYGPVKALDIISTNRKVNHNNNAQTFFDTFDDEEFQLGQILFDRKLVKDFPTGNHINNDYHLFRNIAKLSKRFKYIKDKTWVQTTDGNDNISFPKLNSDERFC